MGREEKTYKLGAHDVYYSHLERIQADNLSRPFWHLNFKFGGSSAFSPFKMPNKLELIFKISISLFYIV